MFKEEEGGGGGEFPSVAALGEHFLTKWMK